MSTINIDLVWKVKLNFVKEERSRRSNNTNNEKQNNQVYFKVIHSIRNTELHLHVSLTGEEWIWPFVLKALSFALSYIVLHSLEEI